ncbi:tetratricopeptide repeat protein 7A isoform X1 [Pygocentrus nattereri]|uniref:Tetratricopeptide repeat protein 7A n=2 Tax=Pygocentrus nattereri TaxID=42514 RepID=A0AAR2KQU1_PYGNA|nr:tetratricopeptide repeat protein 7A isoform X1 [Pygocentrus nattereri]
MANLCKENETAKSIFRRLECAVTPLVSGDYGHRDIAGMSSRISFSQYRLEAEIERCRAECQWDKIPPLLEQLAAARLHEQDDYGTLLLAEALLEECLLENVTLLKTSTPLSDQTQPKLAKAKAHLNSLLSRGRLEPHYLNEALLLLAKVHYVQGRYRDAQGMCARAGIEEFTRDEQPIYHLRLLAEAFVIKGLSLDHQTVSAASRVRLSEREEECLSCYLRACDTALLYLQELDKTVSTPSAKTAKSSISSPPVEVDPGYFLQAALQSAYLCLLHKGHLAQGTHQLRRVMRVMESRGSRSFRKGVSRKLAEVLLSSVSEDSYWGPLSTPPPTWLHMEGATHPKETIYPSSRPPQRYSTEGAFCPQDVVEEAVLLLLITESMASGEAVISRTPEHQEAREASIQEASSVYDMLSIGMARRGQYAMLSQCLERAMKFSFNEFHLWYQLGLSLMASGKAEGAVSVFKECARMKPQDPTPPLLAAKVCINQLHWIEEAEALAQSVVALGEGAEESLARAHLAIGLCCSLRASDATLKGDRDEFNRRALQALQTAHEVDPQDPQIALYLSLQLALVRQVSAAMEPLQLALRLRSEDLHSLHLLALLLSAQKHYQHALDTLTVALNQYPENFNLLFTKVKLEEALFGPAVALQTCEDMLQLWQSRYDFARPSEVDDSSSIPPPEPSPISRKSSGLHLTLPDFQETETGSQSAPSLAVSRLEQAMSEVSAISSTHRQGPAYIWTTLERIWLQAGELFMADGRVKEAQFCVQEAAALFPTSHSVLLLKGQLAELRGNDAEAKSLYDEALAINPTGQHILIHMGKLLVRTGRVGLGEKVLRDAVQAHSVSHEAWSGLGEALQSRASTQAPDCFLTALELEASCPIRPFTVIPREL